MASDESSEGLSAQRPQGPKADSASQRPSAKTHKVAHGHVRSAPKQYSTKKVQVPAEDAARKASNAASGGVGALGDAALRAFASARRLSPRSLLGIAGVVVVMLAVVGVLAASCSGLRAASGPGAQHADGAIAQASGADAKTDAELAAELAWRDSDFVVNPAFRNWSNDDNGRKVVYLTIDDGPSELTESFLDLLDEYGVKATFFVTGHDPRYYGMIKEVYRRGHTIGLHTMTHDYAQVYASEQAYYDDLAAIAQVVKDQIGYIPCFIRFPGGSSNSQAVEQSKDKDIMKKLTAGVVARGYQYYDWSLSSGDGANLSKKDIIAQSTQANGSSNDPTLDTNIILLCHDSATKQPTLDALPKIIEHYQSLGYTFEAIDRKTWICHHALFVDDEDEQEEL